MGSLRLPAPAFRISLFGAVLLLAAPAAASAQGAAQAPAAPAHFAFVDGDATLEREGQAETAASGMPLVPGDRLRTTRGRVEVLFSDGSALDVDEFADIELQSPTLLRLTSGRVMLIVAGVSDPANAVRYQVDTPVASALTDGPGEYRIAWLSGPGETELAVFRGAASLSTETGSTAVGRAAASVRSTPSTWRAKAVSDSPRKARPPCASPYAAVAAIAGAPRTTISRMARAVWR